MNCSIRFFGSNHNGGVIVVATRDFTILEGKLFMVYDNNDGPIYSSIQSKGCPGTCVPYWVFGSYATRAECVGMLSAGYCDQCWDAETDSACSQ